MAKEIYQKVLDRIAPRKQLTSDERNSLKILVSILLDKLLAILKQSTTVILEDNDKIITITVGPDIITPILIPILLLPRINIYLLKVYISAFYVMTLSMFIFV